MPTYPAGGFGAEDFIPGVTDANISQTMQPSTSGFGGGIDPFGSGAGGGINPYSQVGSGGGLTDGFQRGEMLTRTADGGVIRVSDMPSGAQPGMGYSSPFPYSGDPSSLGGAQPGMPGGGGTVQNFLDADNFSPQSPGGSPSGPVSGGGGQYGGGGVGFPPMQTTSITGGGQPGVGQLETIPYTERQSQFQNPYMDMMQNMMGQKNFGYGGMDLSALLGGPAGGAPGDVVQQMLGAMRGEIDLSRSKAMEALRGGKVERGFDPGRDEGITQGALANFLGEFEPRAAARMAENIMPVAQFGMGAAGMQNQWMQNMMDQFYKAGYGGRSKTEAKGLESVNYNNPYGGIGVSF